MVYQPRLWIAKKNKCFLAIFSKIIDFHNSPIKIIFLWSYLASDGSGMSRNVFLSYFLPIVHAAGAFFFWRIYIFWEFWTCHFLKKILLSGFLSVLHAAGAFFFWKIAHFQNFGHDNFPKSVFFVKNSILGVIICPKNIIFTHIIGPLTLDPS